MWHHLAPPRAVLSATRAGPSRLTPVTIIITNSVASQIIAARVPRRRDRASKPRGAAAGRQTRRAGDSKGKRSIRFRRKLKTENLAPNFHCNKSHTIESVACCTLLLNPLPAMRSDPAERGAFCNCCRRCAASDVSNPNSSVPQCRRLSAAANASAHACITK